MFSFKNPSPRSTRNPSPAVPKNCRQVTFLICAAPLKVAPSLTHLLTDLSFPKNVKSSEYFKSIRALYTIHCLFIDISLYIFFCF